MSSEETIIKNEENNNNNVIRISFRTCRPTDIPICTKIEQMSYPSDEAASTTTLQFRQHHAERYFRVCTICDNNDSNNNNNNNDNDDGNNTVIGFICGTICNAFNEQSMKGHDPTGRYLAIHSVVVTEQYRRKGIATQMVKDYIDTIRSFENCSFEKIVLIGKEHLLSFYIHCGFRVTRPSPIIHGQEQWYEFEMDVQETVQSCYVVDAFVTENSGGTGNPAAVVPLETNNNNNNRSTEWMQTVAMEFNLSETAFVWKLPYETMTTTTAESANNVDESNNDDDDNIVSSSSNSKPQIRYGIRYFTPTIEVALCGHATLASAAVLYQTGQVNKDTEIVFQANHDILKASYTSQSGRITTKVSMIFPTKPVTPINDNDLGTVKNMLKSAVKNIEEKDILFVGLSEGLGDIFIEVTAKTFHEIGYESSNINIKAFLDYDKYSRGVIICCSCSNDDNCGENNNDKQQQQNQKLYDFYSRFFGPKAGIDEDPVTGSAHCALAPYFANKLNKSTVVGKQMSKRSGIIECELYNNNNDDDDDDKQAGESDESKNEITSFTHVKLTGTAITAMSGSLWI